MVVVVGRGQTMHSGGSGGGGGGGSDHAFWEVRPLLPLALALSQWERSVFLFSRTHCL